MYKEKSMSTYTKNILTIQQQLQAYIDAGMNIPSISEATQALATIGYYRLRGYCFHLYNNQIKQYRHGTDFSEILRLYQFDTELSHLLFSMTSSIEVALRARLTDALLTHGDSLILYNPNYFSNKKLFWQNLGTLSSEIARSSDVFIQHNFQNHDGQIPIWAAVEVMSFGNLSKTIKNLKTGSGSAASKLIANYRHLSPNGHMVNPSLQMFCSWIQSVSILRNMCAHNSRIYNRTISTHLQIPAIDQPNPVSRRNGLYQIVLAMKYLRPSDDIWKQFVIDLTALFNKYNNVIDMARINFPADWNSHLIV